jgi:hypothetical protein
MDNAVTNTKVSLVKYPKLHKSQNYMFLRETGLKYIEDLSSAFWTDYNEHDPGLTILEALCYAITDLGYRTSFDIKDLLEKNPGLPFNPATAIKEFFTAAEILPCNPVNATDLRKLIIDTDGVHNAWVQKSENCGVAIYVDKTCGRLGYKGTEDSRLVLNGLYDIKIEYDDDYISLLILTTSKTETTIKAQVRLQILDKLMEYRNLCEDYCSLSEIENENVRVCADIEITSDAIVEEVMAEILYKTEEFLSPEIYFYTIEEMFSKGKTADEIFEGPLLDHGFINNDELAKADLPTEIHLSDLINILMDIPGVVAIREIIITKLNTSQAIGPDKWILPIENGRYPELDKDKCRIKFYKENLPYFADRSEVNTILNDKKARARKPKLLGHETDIEIPEGNYRNLTDYYPVQNELPACYGTGKYGFPDGSDSKRKAKYYQLKEYLLFFEQVLANYLAQLSNVSAMFAISPDLPKTYFSQAISSNELKYYNDIYKNYSSLAGDLETMDNNEPTNISRRNRILDHLLGRFNEQMTDYTLLLYTLAGSNSYGKKISDEILISDKRALLIDYPEVSKNRGKGFDYTDINGVWNTNNVIGLERRVCRLLGIDDFSRRNLAFHDYEIINKSDGTYYFKVNIFELNIQIESESNINIDFINQLAENFLADACSLPNYEIANTTPGEFTVKIKIDGQFYASCLPANLPNYTSSDEANTAVKQMVEFFNRWFNMEGLHVFEHILLRPQTNADLLIPVCSNDPAYTLIQSGFITDLLKFEIYQAEQTGSKKTWKFRIVNASGEITINGIQYKNYAALLKGITEAKKVLLKKENVIDDITGRGKLLSKIIQANYAKTGKGKLFETEDDLKKAMSLLSACPHIPGTDVWECKEGINLCSCESDPYSFRITVVLPGWTIKGKNINYRRFVEKTIRMETPAHIYPKICWISNRQMKELEEIYELWLYELAMGSCTTEIYKCIKEEFIFRLINLRNIYPVGTLSDCVEELGDNDIILGSSALGTI